MLLDSIIIASYCIFLISLFTLSGQTIITKLDEKLSLTFINPIIIGSSIYVILLYFLYHFFFYFSLLISNLIAFFFLFLYLSIYNYRNNLKKRN